MSIPEKVDPSDGDQAAPLGDAEPLRRIVAAEEAVDRAEAHLQDMVRAALDAGLSWTLIAAVMRSSPQDVCQRLGVHSVKR